MALCALGREKALLDETAQTEVRTRWVDAAEAYGRGRFEHAAQLYAESGALPFEAFTRLKAAERLISEGRGGEAQGQLEKSLAFWHSVGATRYVREAEELLAASV